MKKVIMTLAALSLFASGPAFAGAGCSSQGGGYARSDSGSSTSAPAPRATAERKAAAAKLMAAQEAQEAAAIEGLADAKLPKQAIAAVEAVAGTSGLADEMARECKQYSATIGSLISVACE